MTLVPAPTFSTTVNQSFFIEPLNGPDDPLTLLDRFPDTLYDKSPDSHFVRFMFALLGPAGIAWLKKDYLDARLMLIAHGFETFDIEKFYADPFRFGRILTEQIQDFPEDLLTRDEWDLIKAKDEAYRSRAITFFNAARLGSTPRGMELASQSGIDHEVEIIENYKYLFDLHSDAPLDLPYYGQTTSTNEFIIIPRQATSRSEVQTLTPEDTTIVAGSYRIVFRGQSTPTILWDADNLEIGAALQGLSTIGLDGVSVSGGPFPNPFTVTFTGSLANQDVPDLDIESQMSDQYGTVKTVFVTTAVGGVSSVDEAIGVSPQLEHNLQTAIDLLRPVPSVPTFGNGRGTKVLQAWDSVTASSNYVEVIRYLTGNPNINWPPRGGSNWVEPSIENESQRTQTDLQHHYTALHGGSAIAYTDAALEDENYATDIAATKAYNSEHIGQYNSAEKNLFPALAAFTDDSQVFSAASAIHDRPDGVEVTAQAGGVPLVKGTLDITVLSNSQVLRPKKNDRHWSSLERQPPAADILEVDLGEVRPVNLLSFDLFRKPITFTVDYDKGDLFPARDWEPVQPWPEYPSVSQVTFDSTSQAPWEHLDIYFKNLKQTNVLTRFIRLTFTRQESTALFGTSRLMFTDPLTRLNPIAYSIDVRNLKVGRYHNPYAQAKSFKHLHHALGNTDPVYDRLR